MIDSEGTYLHPEGEPIGKTKGNRFALFLHGAVRCDCTVESLGIFRRTADDGQRDVLVKAIWAEGYTYVPMSPASARVAAAALLNAADVCDGLIPLVFFPPSPDGEEPTP